MVFSIFSLSCPEVGLPGQLQHVQSLLLPVLEALPDELLRVIRHVWLGGKLHFGGLEDDVVGQNGGLALVVAEGFLAVEALVKEDAQGPHVHLARDLGRIGPHLEALGRNQ